MTRKSKLIPWLFISPALLLLTVFIVYPTLRTISLSLYRGTILNPTKEFVGLSHYVRLLTKDPLFLNLSEFPPSGALINNVVWLVLFTGATVGIGMVVAVLSDRVRYESVVKAAIFVPMVISATAASVIFRFVFSPDPLIGSINAAITSIGPSVDPVAWLGRTSLVNLAVIGAGTWIWTGLSMVVLSAAYKALPAEVLEAAAVDGATGWQTFWRISVPMMAGPIAFIATTMVINGLKMLDLILVMTQGGPRGASRIIGFTVYWEMFNNNKLGYGSSVAVILFILIIPIMVIQVRRIRAEEGLR